MVRTRTWRSPIASVFVVAVAFVLCMPFEVTALGSDVPAGVYAKLAGDQDLENCASDANMSALAYVTKYYAVSPLRLTSGTTVYMASYFAPKKAGCVGKELVVLAGSGPGAPYHYAFVGAADEKKAFHTDGTAVFMTPDETAKVRDRRTWTFDGTDYKESVVRIYLPTGETKAYYVLVQFAPGASSATVTGKIYITFKDHYLLRAQAGQTMTVEVHATSGTLGTMMIYDDYPDFDAKHGPSHVASVKFRSSGYKTIDIYGGDDTPATYQMTIAIH